MAKTENGKRKRAGWRFRPEWLKQLDEFAASQKLRTTQTEVIEVAVTEYIRRNGASAPRNARSR
jgi:hypothetical protein